MRTWLPASLLLLLLLPALGSCAPAPQPPTTGPAWAEEFVGPLAGWRNLKTDYGAKGDGVTDDTVVLQQALDDLRLHRESNVLYLPAGTYRLTAPVKTIRSAHTDCMGVWVVGEDPATTKLKWDGPEGGIMFTYDAWYSKISRLTFDGQGKAGVCLAYGPAFSTYNETSDMVFADAGVGMQMAIGEFGQAENAVLRCQFLRCTDTGLKTVNFNSLDEWVWYCRFQDCGYGLYNGAGNFHAYGCLFERSRKADIGTSNLMTFSFVNNTSIGSNCFLDFSGGHTWGSSTSITGNRILEPTGDWAFRLGNGGPYFVANNVIKARPGVTKPVVGMTWGDQVFLGNTYSSPNPVQEAGRFLRISDDKIVDPATIDSKPPALPPTPPRKQRKVFPVAAGADAATIQAAIDQAVKLKGQHPVVHLPRGQYQVAATVTIPAGADVQLVGDGAAETATVLRWSGAAGGVLLHLAGPSVATVRDLALQSENGTCLKVDKCDQAGGKLFADQLNACGINPGRGGVGVLVNGVEQSDLFMRCLQGATFCTTWVRVVGGPDQQAGKPTPGQTTVMCGATGTAEADYAVEQGGRLVVRGVYHEVSGEASTAILLNDRGSLSIDATRFSYKTTAEHPLIRAEGFRGDFALLSSLLLPVNSTYTCRLETAGDCSQANLLLMSNNFWVNELGVTADKVLVNNATPPARAALLGCNMNSGTPGAAKIEGGNDGFGRLENRGEPYPAWITRLVQPTLQARAWSPQTGPAGVTNVQLHRVIATAGAGGVGVEFGGR